MKVDIRPHRTHPGWYQLSYRLPGERNKKYVTAFSWEQAQADKAAIENKSANITTILRPKIKDVVDEYLIWVELNQSAATYKDKLATFKTSLTPHFGEYRPGELSQSTFDTYHQKLKGKRASIVKNQHYLMSLINWMIKRNMADRLSFTPGKITYHASKAVIPSMQDIQAVIDSEKNQVKQMLLVTMLWTGLRWNEARLIRWEDVYPKQGIIRVRESDQEAEVHVAIYPDMLKWFTDNKKKSGWVFPSDKRNKKGEVQPWTSFKKSLKSASSDMITDITHHDFRRRSGQNVYEATGHDVFAAQAHLRHKDIRTTMRYLGIDDQRRTQINMAVVNHVKQLVG
jgi:integrase